MREFKLFSLFFLVVFSESCDPIISYQFDVKNESEKKLVFSYSHGGLYPKDSLTICNPKSKCVIDSVTIWGSDPHDEGKKFLSALKSLKLHTKDSSEITKNIYLRKNWTYSNKISHFGLTTVGRNIYTLKIENKDICRK